MTILGSRGQYSISGKYLYSALKVLGGAVTLELFDRRVPFGIQAKMLIRPNSKRNPYGSSHRGFSLKLTRKKQKLEPHAKIVFLTEFKTEPFRFFCTCKMLSNRTLEL